MFNGCRSLTDFKSDLSSLSSGENMFKGCRCLTNFKSSLPSLSSAEDMFKGCKLNTASVVRIANTIPSNPDPRFNVVTLGLGCKEETADDEVLEAFEVIRDKGWRLEVEYNG